MKYFIIAGEASGDLHGSNLIKALHQVDNEADIQCWGGDKMEQEGATLMKHYCDLAFMGFIEVLQNIRTIKNNFAQCKADILRFRPNALVLIDYPGFNLRMARWAHEQGIKVHYYIAPKVWAWNESRVKNIKKYVDFLYIIFPFEVDFFTKHGVKFNYVGNPLVEVIQEYKSTNTLNINEKEIIILMPGSRTQEITRILPVMLEMVDLYPQYQFVVTAVKNQPLTLYKDIIKNKNVQIEIDNTYEVLNNATFGIIKSGTSTLETALFDVPQVVVYKANPISMFIAKRLVKIKYIALVNLIMNKLVVTELIQENCNVKRLHLEVEKMIHNQEQIKADYIELRKILGEGNASKKVAELIFNC
jgi:lipid-A-disaccharide synthase